MANGGWYGTAEEWQQLEAPLVALDDELTRLADEHGFVLTRNRRDGPNRMIEWNAQGIPCLMQIWLSDDKTLRLNFWICASQDRGGDRFWKREMLKQDEDPAVVRSELARLFEMGRCKLGDWCARPETFEFATKLSAPPPSWMK